MCELLLRCVVCVGFVRLTRGGGTWGFLICLLIMRTARLELDWINKN